MVAKILILQFAATTSDIPILSGASQNFYLGICVGIAISAIALAGSNLKTIFDTIMPLANKFFPFLYRRELEQQKSDFSVYQARCDALRNSRVIFFKNLYSKSHAIEDLCRHLREIVIDSEPRSEEWRYWIRFYIIAKGHEQAGLGLLPLDDIRYETENFADVATNQALYHLAKAFDPDIPNIDTDEDMEVTPRRHDLKTLSMFGQTSLKARVRDYNEVAILKAEYGKLKNLFLEHPGFENNEQLIEAIAAKLDEIPYASERWLYWTSFYIVLGAQQALGFFVTDDIETVYSEAEALYEYLSEEKMLSLYSIISKVDMSVYNER